MALPYWQEKGRIFALEVFDAFEEKGGGMFLPQDAMREWFEHENGSGIGMFEGENYQEMIDLVSWALTIPAARRDFARGYKDGMRETRAARKAKAAARVPRAYDVEGL